MDTDVLIVNQIAPQIQARFNPARQSHQVLRTASPHDSQHHQVSQIVMMTRLSQATQMIARPFLLTKTFQGAKSPS